MTDLCLSEHARFDVEEMWTQEFGETQEGRDYAGRKVLKDEFGRYGSRYGWTVEKIQSDGADYPSNLHIVNGLTERERDGRSEFSANAHRFRIRKTQPHLLQSVYSYACKDFCPVQLDPETDLWTAEFGDSDVGYDFAGREVRKAFCHRVDSAYGWDIDHIYPLSKHGKDESYNMQICNIRTNREKADKTEFEIDGAAYAVARCVDVTDAALHEARYRYADKDYCVLCVGDREDS